MARPSKQLQIVRAARALFIELGYQATSVELLVARAGVSKPTIYNHFATKQSMLEDMLAELAGEMTQILAKVSHGAEKGSLAAAISVYQMIATNPEFMAAYRIRIGESHKLEAKALQLFEQLDSAIDEWFNGWFAEPATVQLVQSFCRDQLLTLALNQKPGLSADQLLARLSNLLGEK